MEQKWVTRSYRDGDEEGIFELWKAVFPERQFDKEGWLKWWRWIYMENPAGNSWIFLADDNGKIIGQHPRIPGLIKVGTNIVKSQQGTDAMTHPQYRGRGIYQGLQIISKDEATKNGVQVGYGFPNENSHPITVNKLGSIDIGKMQTMFMPFNWRKTISLRVRNKYLQVVLAIAARLVFNRLFCRIQEPPRVEGLTIKHITSFDERFDELWTRICNQSQIMVVRNRAYLNWRYNPPDTNFSIFAAESDQQIRGYIVIKHQEQDEGKTCIIFDLIAESEKIIHHLISKALEECHSKGTDVIIYNSITNKTYHRIFKRNGFISLPFIKGAYFILNYHSLNISEKFLYNLKNWMVQWGDSDAI